MSASLTYAQLVANLPGWVEDENDEFVGNIDQIIGLAELMILRDLNLSIFDTEDTLSITSGSNLLTKPSGLVKEHSISYYDSQGQLVYLNPRSRDWVRDYGGVGDPLFYCEQSETQWKVAPGPNENRTATLVYTQRPAQLSAATKTTWLSTNVADLLQYACLVACEEFLKADDRIAIWKAKYGDLLATAKLELRHLIRPDYAVGPP